MIYKEMQIMKHALQLYVQREGATEKDIEEETILLRKMEDQVEMFKELYGYK